MRTETTTRELYTFAELSDEAKERAREDYRRAEWESGDIYWSESVIEDADTIAAILGIDISRRTQWTNGATVQRSDPAIYWSIGGSGEGACFSGRYSYAKGSGAAIRKHAPQDVELHRIADALQRAQRRNFYKLWADIVGNDRYFTTRASVESDHERELSPVDAEDIEQAIRDFASWIFHQLRAADEYHVSDECVNDYLTNGDDEFTEDGRRA